MSHTRQLGGSQRLLDASRGVFEADMRDTVQIMRPGALVSSGDFGGTRTYTLLGIVPGDYWALTGGEAMVLQRLDVKASVTVALPFDTDVNEKDQLVYTILETGEIHHFEISYVYDGPRRHTLRLACVEYKFDN